MALPGLGSINKINVTLNYSLLNHIIGCGCLDLSVLLTRRSLPHLGRRGYNDEGFPTNVLKVFPLGTWGRILAIILVHNKSLSFSPYIASLS